VGHLPLPQPTPPSSNKREREPNNPCPDPPTFKPDQASFKETVRPTAGSRRVSSKDPSMASQGVQLQLPIQQPQPLPDFPLPMHSDELGRLPLHGEKDLFSYAQSPGDVNDWFSELLPSGAMPSTFGGEPQGLSVPYSSSGSTPSSDAGSLTGGTYSMDQVYFDQMATGFPTSVGQGAGHGQPPYDNQFLDSGMQPRGLPHPQTHPSHFSPYRAPNVPGVPNAHDIDMIAMWSNASSGFE
jgi:hypothetical protein